MAATAPKKRARKAARPADDIEYGAEILSLIAQLRERDNNSDCADWPVIDIYARISKVTDALDSEKVPRQIVDCLRRMLERDWRLGEIFADPNKSAWDLFGKRPQFEQLLLRIESKANQGVLCWNVDRLFRQPWDLERLLLLVELKQAHKERYLISSCYEDHKLRDVFTLRIKAAVAAEESRLKSERIRRLNEARKAAGIIKGGPSPFGHRNPGDSHISDLQLSAEREAIKWGVHHVANGGSLGSVAREWNQRGLTTRAGLHFDTFNVRTVLLHGRHAGLILDDDNRVVRTWVNVDAIVEAEIFILMLGRFEGRKKGSQSGESEHFLSSLIFCDRCANTMVGSTYAGSYDDGQPRRQYRCSARGCANVSVDARAAEYFASLHVGVHLSDPRNAARIAERSQALASVSKQISTYDRIIDDLNAKGISFPDQYEKYSAHVNEVEKLRQPLVQQRDSLLASGAASVASTGDLESVMLSWRKADPAQRRVMFEQAMPAGFWVAPVGRGRRLRGDAILDRFGLQRGEASARFAQ